MYFHTPCYPASKHAFGYYSRLWWLMGRGGLCHKGFSFVNSVTLIRRYLSQKGAQIIIMVCWRMTHNGILTHVSTEEKHNILIAFYIFVDGGFDTRVFIRLFYDVTIPKRGHVFCCQDSQWCFSDAIFNRGISNVFSRSSQNQKLCTI